MNILFYTSFEVSPEKGGTERITSSVAKVLTECYDHKCFSAYGISISPEFRRTPFVAKVNIQSLRKQKNRNVIRRFIVEKEIDVVVSQGSFKICKQLKEICSDVSDLRFILVHHFEPGWEENYVQITQVLTKPTGFVDVLRKVYRIARFPYQYLMRRKNFQKQYKEGYENATCTVLLSNAFIPQYMEYAGLKECRKFHVIPNMLSFDEFLNMADYKTKSKEVLIVSRLTEAHKRLSLAIKIWSMIECDHELDEWTLRIVGHGEDEQKYKNLVHQLGLKRVFFEGAHQSLEYYRRASLFMMTSISEGWGLTLTEAQQMGCVPLAFDTYASLHDIITDGENGCIVPECDLEEYVKRLKDLILNDSLRHQMAEQAVASSYRFSHEKIGEQWHALLMEACDKS